MNNSEKKLSAFERDFREMCDHTSCSACLLGDTNCLINTCTFDVARANEAVEKWRESRKSKMTITESANKEACMACIVRTVDELGRIVIPKEFRRTLKIREGDRMEIVPHGEGVLMTPYRECESYATRLSRLLQDIEQDLDIKVEPKQATQLMEAALEILRRHEDET